MNLERNLYRELRRFERKVNIRFSVVTAVFIVLISLLIFYAIRVENRLTELLNSPVAVVYKDETTSHLANEETTSHSNDKSLTEDVVSEPESTDDVSNWEASSVTNELTTADVTTEITEYSTSVAGPESVTTEKFTEPSTAENSEKSDAQFYVTRTGNKFHVSSCTYLSSSMIPISWEEIEEKGYQPCSKCIE